jgi:hypothetical protein
MVDPDTLSRSSGPNVRFSLGPGFSSLLGLSQGEAVRVRQLVAEHDAVIARLPSEYGLAAARAARALHKPFLVEVGCARDAYWNPEGPAARPYKAVAGPGCARAFAPRASSRT